MEKLPKWCVTDTRPALYDVESATAIEQTAKLYGAMNELIDETNEFTQATNEHIEQYEERVNNHIEEQDDDIEHQKTVVIPQKITDEVQAQINNGTFDNQINEYAGDLEGRLDNLLNHTPEGSTTMDAEIIDARLGEDGTTYANLGTALREQLGIKSGIRTTEIYDANECKEMGVYFISSVDPWENVPDEQGGVLNVYYGGRDTRLYQQFYSYDKDRIYVRRFKGTAFTEWELLTNEYDFNVKNSESFDLNNYDKMGLYSVSSMNTYENSPFDENSGGAIAVFTNKGSSTMTYQLAFPYAKNKVMLRCKKADNTWSEWDYVLGATPSKLLSNTLTISDLNEVTDNSIFFVSSQNEHVNLPEYNYGGMLLNYCGENNTQALTRHYQIFLSYSNNAMYYRNILTLGNWSEWKKLITSLDIDNVVNETHSEFYVEKVSNTKIYIYKKGNNGYIRYEYLNQVNNTINLDTWKIGTIYLCDKNKNATTEISSSGADQEGVLKIAGENDYIGGVHGDEQYTDFIMFIDGKICDIATMENVYADEIRIVVKSNITHCDTTNVCMHKVKQTTFDKNGVHVNNRWTTLEQITLQHVRAILLSVNKSCISKYYDSVVNTFPMDVPTTGGGVNDNNMIDTYYMGNINARVWCGERGGDVSGYASNITDFGTRLKSYFDCYTNYTASAGETLYCENNFYISC